jgi:predicted transposase YbfD/YdcC
MKSDLSIPFLTHFGKVSDPRQKRTKRYCLPDILFLCVCAVLCGADDCVAIAEFGRSRVDWLKQFTAFDDGTPSHDTISRVLSLINPREFELAFVAWIAAIQKKTAGQIVAIDGKTMRHTFDIATGQEAIHMVSAWGSANGLVLGQVKTDTKSNEITAIPKLLAMLDITGCTVTIDAMGTQKEIAKQIIDQGGDYILPVKDNHPNLRADIEAFFERAIADRFLDGNADTIPHKKSRMFDADHGRIETRKCLCTDYLDDIQDTDAWKGIQSIAMIESERELNGKKSVERRYYITSLPPSARRINAAIRTHWGVENSLHWVLDVDFNEDQCRTRKDNGPQIRATLNRIAINICKANTTKKASINIKRKSAGWNPDFLTQLITGK